MNGDLSGDRLAPSSLALDLGLNSVGGSTVAGDLDYIAVIAPYDIAQLVLGEYTSTNGISFIGVQAGASFTEPNVGANAANLLGWTHFGYDTSATQGTDILDNMGAAVPAMGFTGALPAGTYTFRTQQTGPQLTNYRFDFPLAPEPGALTLAGLSLAVLAGVRRSRA